MLVSDRRLTSINTTPLKIANKVPFATFQIPTRSDTMVVRVVRDDGAQRKKCDRAGCLDSELLASWRGARFLCWVF